MRRLMIGLVAASLASACKRPPAPSSSSDAGDRAEVRIGVGSADDGPSVAFQIEHVYTGQRVMDSAPWHREGGDWSFYDAKTHEGVPFGFGLREKEGNGKFSFGDAMLTVPNREAGARLVEHFARTFHGNAPAAKPSEPLRFKPFVAAILAKGAVREKGSGFAHGGGDWTATKLFLQRNDREAEVFFNFNPATMIGEFSEKDADYADAMLAFLAAELRDGPRRRRTPEMDPSLSNVGPKIEGWRTIAPSGAEAYGFFTASRYGFTLTEGESSRLFVVPLEPPAEPTELFRANHRIASFKCSDDHQLLCLAEDSNPKEKGVISSNDPQQIVLVDRQRGTRAVIAGPWGERGSLAIAPLAPDGSILAVEEWRKRDGGKGAYQVAHLITRLSDARREVDFGEAGAEVVGWVGRGPTLRAVVRRGHTWDKTSQISYFSVDPRTGAQEEKKAFATSEDDESVSPDGRHRVECRDRERIVVTDLTTRTSREFQVHADDRDAVGEGCVTWAGPRYLRFDVDERIGFIDTQTMKLSYMFGENEEHDEGRLLDFSKDFRWVVRHDKTSIRAARVVVK